MNKQLLLSQHKNNYFLFFVNKLFLKRTENQRKRNKITDKYTTTQTPSSSSSLNKIEIKMFYFQLCGITLQFHLKALSKNRKFYVSTITILEDTEIHLHIHRTQFSYHQFLYQQIPPKSMDPISSNLVLIIIQMNFIFLSDKNFVHSPFRHSHPPTSFCLCNFFFIRSTHLL